MKKILTIIALIGLAIPASAQWGSQKVKGNGNKKTITRSISDYDKVNVSGSFDVFLVAGKEGEITIEAVENLMEYIITETEGNSLKIKTEKGYNLQPSNRMGIIITVPFEDLDEVTLAGSGDIQNKDLIKSNSFECSVSGSGDMVLDVEGGDIEASVAGSGDLTLRGSADKLEVNVTGSGDIHGKEMKAHDTEANVTGSGDIVINCDGGNLKARVTGSGDIQYVGDPAKEDFKVTGSGSISN
ncbi:MAG: head GIN domain-containing protein [Leeuwenhoekiella sp.]